MRGCIVVVKYSSPPFPQFRSYTTRTISHTLQNIHVESYIDSLNLRCEFVVQNSMAVKNQQHNFNFYLLFRVCLGLGYSLCFHCSATSARGRNRRSTIRRVWWTFRKIYHFRLRFFSQRKTWVATFDQEWAVSVQSWHKPFSCPNVPSKSCERTTFPNQFLLLSFLHSIAGHWA